MGTNVNIDVSDGIAWIAIDDGKVNAMSVETMNAISAALDAAEASQAVAVLRGREGIFSAGFDLKTFQRGPEEGVEMVQTGAELILRFLRFPLPIMTVCTGHAYPMGAFLMLSSEARLGISGPWKIGLNEVAIGMTIPKFAIELARHRLTPPAFARAASGYLFSPEEALRAGYFDVLVEPGELDSAAQAEAQRLRALDMPSFVATKQRINEQAIEAIEGAVAAELAQFTSV